MDRQCNKYVWEDIRVFSQSYSVDKVKTCCKSDIVNHVIFAFLVLTLVGGISAYLLQNVNVFIVFMILTVLHAIMWYLRYDSSSDTVITENFQQEEPGVPDGLFEDVIGEQVTYPNAKNPFMNVLVDEIKYNPTRPSAATVFDPSVSIQLEDFFKTQFINDPTDVFNKSQGQRQFYTMPSTTVPNDQESYQNWLYKIPGKTCKEGNRLACSSSTGSAGAVIPWLSDN
jgi:hypothetical protein